MGFFETDFGKMILFMFLGICFAIVLLGFTVTTSPSTTFQSSTRRTSSSFVTNPEQAVESAY